MTRRPLCLVCLILMLCMWIAELAGIPLISGVPLPDTVQTYIEKHPAAVICGEVQQCQTTEFSFSVCLKHVFLIVRSGVPLPDTVQTYIEKHPAAVICGEVQQCQTTEFSFSVCLKHVFLIVRSEKIPIENVKVFLKKEEDLPPGTQAVFSGQLESVGDPRNPGEFDSRQYHACQHIYYFMKKAVLKKKSTGYSGYRQKLLELKEQVLEILRNAAGKLKEQVLEILRNAAGKDSPVFEAMLLGEKTELEQEVKMRYQMAGMIHILAISGLHISILGMGLFSLLKKIGLGNGTAGLLSLMVMLQYGIFTGWEMELQDFCLLWLCFNMEYLQGEVFPP